ncbi:unnamed protein product [[Candida] boidinii]|nr:unnamed protein product [[Candida] boidinii]
MTIQTPQESQKAHQPQNSQDLSDEFYDTPSTDEESSAGLNNLSEGCYRIIDDNKAGKNTFTIGEKLTQAEIDSEEVGYYFKYNGKEDSKILKSRISLCNNEPENCKENYLKSKGINMKLIEKYDKTDSSRGAAKYCPIYVQTICEKTGESIKNKGLCPYCPTSKTDPYKNFYSLHDSSYLHHVTKIHGILRTGKKIPSPIMSGKFIASKSLGPRSKRSKNIAKQAVTCHCKAIVKVKDNDTDPKKQYLAYFRHYLENHYAGVNKSKKHNNCAK